MSSRPEAPPQVPPRAAATARPALSLTEFVAMIAMTTATIAFSIDAMLPALPEIGAALSPQDVNRAQLVIMTFLFGMGTGTLFVGPLSDALGRKTVMVGGAVVYSLSSILCILAPSLEMLLVARFLQGIGGSGPRVAAVAMIRDLYAGRDMARVSSFVMMVFTLVPAIAPLIGAGIIAGFGWRAIFWAFVAFSAISATWLMIRQPETLSADLRRPLNATRLRRALSEVARHPNVRRAIVVQTLVFSMLFVTIASVQQIYAETFDRADTFPLWFALVAVLSASASFLNAGLVVRKGMLWILRRALMGHLTLSCALAALWLIDGVPEGLLFPAFLIWQIGSFAVAGLTIGNLNALAMQPMGHIAGMASSVISAVATILGVLIAVPIGLAFDGTPLPMALGVAACASAGLFLARKLVEEPI